MKNRILGYLSILFTLVFFLPTLTAQSVPDNNPIRINSGGEAVTLGPVTFIDGDNDDFGNSGLSYTTFDGEGSILNTTADKVYETERHAPDLEYTIPVIDNECYTIHLHFAEIYWDVSDGDGGGGGSRIFDVSINGVTVLNDYDIIATEGASLTAAIYSYDLCQPLGSTSITLRFTGSEDDGKISAIEIVPLGIAAFGGASTFPVEFLDLEARLTGNAVELNWSTATELNNDFFTVERSIDRFGFESIAEVDGAGTSPITQYYTAYDETPIGEKMYYRIKQTDFDGSFSYSNTIELTVREEALSLRAFPNPTQGRDIQVQVSGFDKEESLKVSIRDITGRVVFQQDTKAGQIGGLSLFVKPGIDWSEGFYILTVSGRTDILTERILIQ